MHNPCQLVVYPLLKLASRGLSPVSYLRALESLIDEALAMDDLKAQALEGQTGVRVRL
jgi:lipoate-protein ligase B